MLRLGFLLICITAILMTLVEMLFAADIAIIDYADQWTQVAALGPSLDEYGYKYDDTRAAVNSPGKLAITWGKVKVY
ncbi:TPA: hypothetical protein EYP66_16245 [Candidatus Poribacteria bacterium]|nr:hypothetical protein [Candidatus Poribacteria bacterium]